jgi:hypothetical protein
MSGNTIRNPGPMLARVLKTNATIRRDFNAAQGYFNNSATKSSVDENGGSLSTYQYNPKSSINSQKKIAFETELKRYKNNQDPEIGKNYLSFNKAGQVNYMAPEEKNQLVGNKKPDEVAIIFGGSMYDVTQGKQVPSDYQIMIEDPSTGEKHIYSRAKGQTNEQHSILNVKNGRYEVKNRSSV